MKLISMTDFVLAQYKEKVPKGCNEHILDALDFEKKCINYANFLKQPLKLEMFVPCDQDGNIWKCPPTKEEWEWAKKDSADAEQSFKQKEYYYKKAKEQVLFEGFRILDNGDKVFCTLGIGKLIITYDYKTKTFLLQKDWTVERLVRFSLTLTPTAIKQIQT